MTDLIRTPLKIIAGHGSAEDREQSFLDGRLVVVSRDGLNFSDRSVLPVLPREKTGRALVIGGYRGIVAHAVRMLNPGMTVIAHYPDAWDIMEAEETARSLPESEIELHLGADPPEGLYDLVVMPMSRHGIVDLVRERIRSAANLWLKKSGVCITSSDHASDRFIRNEMKKAFGAFHISPEPVRRGGIAYVARKPASQLVGLPAGWTEFTYARKGRVLAFQGRTGVFCHDRIDPGTRALLHHTEPEGSRQVLDLGCGTGIVGIVCGLEAPEARVTFLDSNARAVESARANAERYGMGDRSEWILSADPAQALKDLPKFDFIATNPPYYGNRRIAGMFLEAAMDRLLPSGRLLIVTKDLNWYLEKLQDRKVKVEVESRGGYQVLSLVKG